jgi:hypothetical protein
MTATGTETRSCHATGDEHAPAVECRVVDTITPWTDKDGRLLVHEGDLILDQGEMCAVQDIDVEQLANGHLWIHMSLRDPRGVGTGLPVSGHEFSADGLVAVRRYITEHG